MKTARVQVLTTPAFRDWLRKEARKAGVSVAELVRTHCGRGSGHEEPSEEEKAVAELASHLRKEVRKAQASLRSGLAEATAVLEEMTIARERRQSQPRHSPERQSQVRQSQVRQSGERA
jgi:hypothetical protein